VSGLRRLLVALLLAGALLLVLSGSAFAAETGLSPIFPTPVSPNGKDIYTLYEIIAIPAILIFLLVEVLLAIIIIRYRRSAQPLDYVPPQVHGHTVLEVTWTVVPLAIVLAIAGLSFYELSVDFSPTAYKNADMTIEVRGYQFGWDYTYDDITGGDGKALEVNQTGTLAGSVTPLVVPVGHLIKLRVYSDNVIHSWWVPAISGKTDAVPGYDNFTWMKIDQPGKWHGECAELCGAGHSTMQIEVQAMSQSDFDAWVAQQVEQSRPKPSPSPSAASGARTGGSGSSAGGQPTPSASP
jgi:cytochrome c oxidase subunit 2